VLLRKLITERSRDVLKRGSKPGTAVQTPAEEKFYQEQRRLGIDVENSLEEAAAVIDTGVDKGSVVFEFHPMTRLKDKVSIITERAKASAARRRAALRTKARSSSLRR